MPSIPVSPLFSRPRVTMQGASAGQGAIVSPRPCAYVCLTEVRRGSPPPVIEPGYGEVSHIVRLTQRPDSSPGMPGQMKDLSGGRSLFDAANNVEGRYENASNLKMYR